MANRFEIPIEVTDASFKMRTILEGFELIFRFDWVGRQERWSLSIFDGTENPLVMGITLNVNNELIERFEVVGLPPGKLILFDNSLKNLEAGRDDLGQRCKLIYEESV